MSITEFAVHNVLRTYSRQDRLGRLQRQRGTTQKATGDQVKLSPTAQKINLVGQFANALVDRRHPEADAEGRQSLVRSETERLMKENRGAVENGQVSAEQLAEQLNQLYAR
jgi:hypothetical protein